MAISAPLILLLIVVCIMFLGCSELTKWKITLVALLFVPTAAQGLLSGVSYSTPGILNLSLIGYITLIIFGYVIVKRNAHLPLKQIKLILTCFSIILVVRILADGFDFISNKLFDNYFLPMLLAVSVIAVVKVEKIPNLLKFMYNCILIGAILACIEFCYGESLLFHSYYMDTCPWYESIIRSAPYVGFRSSSIFGHPLTGSTYYVLGVVYLLNCEKKKKNKIKWIFQFSVILAALFTTNARSALLGAGIYIVYYLFKNKKISKIVAAIIIVAVALVCVDWAPFYEALFARDSSGSSLMVRVRALMTFSEVPLKTLFFGEGYNNTSNLLTALGFMGNVEIAYLIILYENGLVGFCAWLGSIVGLYGRRTLTGVYSGLNISDTVKGMLFSVLFIGGMSNSFGDPGTLNYLIFLLLAFTTVLAKANRNQEEIQWLPDYAKRKSFRFGKWRIKWT